MRSIVDGKHGALYVSPGFLAWIVVGYVSYTLVIALSLFCYCAAFDWDWSQSERVAVEALLLCLLILLVMAMNFAATTWGITMWRSTHATLANQRHGAAGIACAQRSRLGRRLVRNRSKIRRANASRG
ncbi:MAG: thiol:disulfide interchange protein [Hyphomicrobiaceae bacterium]|jgi:thiol:disulfide interchange protein